MAGFTFIDGLFLVAALGVLGVCAFFAASEIGILSVNRFRLHQLAEDGSPSARALQRLLHNPSRVLTVIIIVITSLQYLDETLVTYWLSGRRGLPEWVPFVSLLVLVLLFAEITPISYAAANPELVATRATPAITAATALLRPLVTAFTAIAAFVLRLFGAEPRPRPLMTGEEVLTIVDIETERGMLEEEEKELIHSIFEFSDTVVREIMVPRIDITAISADTAIARAIADFSEHHYSRLPVYQGSLDHIIGVVYAKDLLAYQFTGRTDGPVRAVARPATFIPETKRVSELLQEFRATKQTLAIVLDEYGGTAGLVTMEDLLEEIVGEIYDEYDVEYRPIEWLDAHTLLVDGKVSVGELSDTLHRPLPEGDYDTVGGLLYSRFGDVPARGETVTIDDLVFTVEQLDGHRITRVRVHAPEAAP
jgi:CBS domain containing-hemolysin-like protein